MKNNPPTPPPPNETQRSPDDQPEKFNAWDPKILKHVDALIDLVKPPKQGEDNRDLVRQMIVTALQAQYSQLERSDFKIMARSTREFRYGFNIFKDYRHRLKVTIFGSARTHATHPEYKQALLFARKMSRYGFMAITGAGPGIMQAGNEGAGVGNSFGINIRLPFEQEANTFISKDPRFIDCRFFFTRKLMFLKETNAVAFFPGGFGTHDEAYETLTLVQTGKCDMIPMVFVDAPGGRYWKDWKEYVTRHLLKTRKISHEDMNLFKVTDSVDQAVAEILRFYNNYHSMRFVKDQLVIRLQKPATQELLRDLNRDFSDICVKGSYKASSALPEENDHADLPRIIFPFDRLHFGRLRMLVDRLNKE